MNKTISLLITLIITIISLPVQAQHNSLKQKQIDRIEHRLTNHRHRIHDGVRSGELTRKETRHLLHQQRHILRLTHRFMHDGYLDRYELRQLKNALDHASHHIYRLKHNHKNHRTGNYYY